MSEVFELYDAQGVLRRPGSWTKPEGFVSAVPPYEDQPEMPLWDDADIRKVLSDPNRRRCEEIFDSAHWISDQLSTSACNGHAAANALSRARYLRGIDDKLVLSGAFVYALINGGRDAGSMLEDGLIAIEKYGAPPASLVGPTMIYPYLQPKSAREAALKHRGLECYRAKTKQGWRSGLAAGFQGIAAVGAGRNFMSSSNLVSLNTGTSCAVRLNRVDQSTGNHAVCISDMRIVNGTEWYQIANSWNLHWGSKGLAWVTWDWFSQCWNNHVFYLIPSTQEV